MKLFEIMPGLYQRGYFAGLKTKIQSLEDYGIDIVVNMYYKTDPDMASCLYMYVCIPISDSIVDGLERIEDMLELADFLADQIEMGHGVLTHCYGGINRSGLMSALIVRSYLGVSGSEAIDIVREGEPRSLDNAAFVDYLEGLLA